MTTTTPLTSYGPQQFPDRVGLTLWQFTRAQRVALIPGPNVAGGRWSAAVFDDVLASIDAIRQAVGAMPDVGAVHAEEHLAERLNMTVHDGTAASPAAATCPWSATTKATPCTADSPWRPSRTAGKSNAPRPPGSSTCATPPPRSSASGSRTLTTLSAPGS
ncbi:hypothetical protein ABT215_43410 [Streptomyces sp900105755]|uniref:hypothetical protein n=1 Tax=Streptomyces sp. 900105755 TaxID=3154389 RepID=UPI00331E96CB